MSDLRTDIAADDLESVLAANVRRLWTTHESATGETQPVLASRMFPWLMVPSAAARQLRRVMSGDWPAKSRIIVGVAREFGVSVSALFEAAE